MTAIAAVLIGVTIASGWGGVTLDTTDLGLTSAESDGERVLAVRVERGQLCIAAVNEPAMPGWRIEPFGWSATYNPPGTPRRPPMRPVRPTPEWNWTHSAYADPSGVVSGRRFPLWLALAPLLAWSAWRWIRFKPLAPGECRRCRYNTAGLDACPECGSSAAR